MRLRGCGCGSWAVALVWGTEVGEHRREDLITQCQPRGDGAGERLTPAATAGGGYGGGAGVVATPNGATSGSGGNGGDGGS